MEYKELLVSDNDFDELLVTELTNSIRKIVIIEGGIGAGKSTAFKYFPEESFIHVPEPIADMKPILEKFYEGKIDELETTRMIEELCVHNLQKAMLLSKTNRK